MQRITITLPRTQRTTSAVTIRRGFGTVAWLCWLAVSAVPYLSTGQAVAAELPSYRSLRDDLPRRLDELDLPRHANRVVGGGWETRTKHFVVFSTLGAEQASRVARHMEGVWAETARLADQWGNAHRRPTVGIGAIGVIVTDRALDPRMPPAGELAPLRYGPGIVLSTAGAGQLAPQQLLHLRREGVLAFLRVTGQQPAFPEWVSRGLADYVAGVPLPERRPERLAPPQWTTSADASLDPSSFRATADTATPRTPVTPDGQLWVQFFLEGNDAQHAPAFFEVLAAAIHRRQTDPRGAEHGIRNFGNATERSDSQPMGQLMTPGVQAEMTAWLADPQVGQPIVELVGDAGEPEGVEDAETERRQQEMIQVLKLARRFSWTPTKDVLPRFTEFRDGASEVLPLEWTEQKMTLAGLHRRLATADRPWATLDANGRMLLSGDRDRLAQWFARIDGRYGLHLRDGRLTIESELPSGEVLKAWLEDNPENAMRPIARIEKKPAAKPTSSKVANWPSQSKASK